MRRQVPYHGQKWSFLFDAGPNEFQGRVHDDVLAVPTAPLRLATARGRETHVHFVDLVAVDDSVLAVESLSAGTGGVVRRDTADVPFSKMTRGVTGVA